MLPQLLKDAINDFSNNYFRQWDNLFKLKEAVVFAEELQKQFSEIKSIQIISGSVWLNVYVPDFKSLEPLLSTLSDKYKYSDSYDVTDEGVSGDYRSYSFYPIRVFAYPDLNNPGCRKVVVGEKPIYEFRCE